MKISLSKGLLVVVGLFVIEVSAASQFPLTPAQSACKNAGGYAATSNCIAQYCHQSCQNSSNKCCQYQCSWSPAGGMGPICNSVTGNLRSR